MHQACAIRQPHLISAQPVMINHAMKHPWVGSSLFSGVISAHRGEYHKVNRSLLFSLNLEFVEHRFFSPQKSKLSVQEILFNIISLALFKRFLFFLPIFWENNFLSLSHCGEFTQICYSKLCSCWSEILSLI